MLFTFIIALIIAYILIYLLTTYPVYVIYKRANMNNAWTAFVPIISSLNLYSMANFSIPVVLLLLLGIWIPVPLISILCSIVLFVINIMMKWRVAKSFGLGIVGCIMSLIVPIFVFWYIVLAKKQFIGINYNR